MSRSVHWDPSTRESSPSILPRPSLSARNVPLLDLDTSGLISMDDDEPEPVITLTPAPAAAPAPIPIVAAAPATQSSMQMSLPAGTLQLAPPSAVIQPPPPRMMQQAQQYHTLPTTAPTTTEEEEELGYAMADDDYSAQQTWQTQSKDNLKTLMDNFSPEQYDRFEAYRRQGLSKQAVRKVIQQQVNTQVSLPIAQIVAGFSKVFIGEIIEKARTVQAKRGEGGPLAPDHLREAYRAYQNETGRVGSARPLRGKKLFVR